MNDRETAALARLRDLVMQTRECVEAKDVRRLGALLEGMANANLNGRFLTGPGLLALAERSAAGIDAPRMHLVRVEALAVEGDVALATYLVDGSWTDLGTWREVHTTALVTFQVRRRTFGWQLEGVTVSELPADTRAAGDGTERGDLALLSGHGVVEETFYSFMGYPALATPA